MERFDESEVRKIAIGDENYPELLKRIKKPPKVLRIRGNLPPNRKIIAISGSRRTTQQALDAADSIGKMLAQLGYITVTGLAHGCDTAATDGALSAGGKVIGVVPRGLKSLQGHTKKLAEKIFAARGTVFSQYPDDLSKIFSRHYLRRDAIITGLSEKTIIIAAEERSGSSATANHALRQGRGVITTRHVNARIEGATLVNDPGELKDALGIHSEGMKYKARIYFHVKSEGFNPASLTGYGPIVHPIAHPEFDAHSVTSAKRQATFYCKNHEALSKWYQADSTSRWNEPLTGLFVRKTFRNPPVGTDPKILRAIVELSIFDTTRLVRTGGD